MTDAFQIDSQHSTSINEQGNPSYDASAFMRMLSSNATEASKLHITDRLFYHLILQVKFTCKYKIYKPLFILLEVKFVILSG